MAEIGKLEITVLDMPKIQRLLKRYEKIQRRLAWKNHAKTMKVREHNMMQKLKEEITAAANRELNRANEQFPLFTSKHEGVAVAYEELEESKEALEELETSFKCLWDNVRGKETPCYLKEEITPLKIADYAINLACEAVQTAAMLMKYEMSLNPAAEREGE